MERTKMTKLRKSSKGDSNPGSLDCEYGILSLSSTNTTTGKLNDSERGSKEHVGSTSINLHFSSSSGRFLCVASQNCRLFNSLLRFVQILKPQTNVH